jgi:hypothetical protein
LSDERHIHDEREPDGGADGGCRRQLLVAEDDARARSALGWRRKGAAVPRRAICWTPIWNPKQKGVGLEHLLLSDIEADSVLLAYGDDGPFRLTYQLRWNESWQLGDAELVVSTDSGARQLRLATDGHGHWRGAGGEALPALDGCTDIDIWPSPFTNTFPIRRASLQIGERREFRVAWVSAPELTVGPQRQAYTRRADRLYLFESLDGSGFQAELPVDENGVVVDYPGLFVRVTG